MTSTATTVEEYLASLPEDRREVVQAVREAILKNLDPKFEETMQYGMISYVLPHSVYPKGYHCNPKQALPYVSIASQKGGISLHLMSVYMNPELDEWFRSEWTKDGRKLDMGKACVKFKKLSDVSLDAIGAVIARVPADVYVAKYESILTTRKK